MASILSNISLMVTEAISWVGDFVDVVVAQPLLLAFVIVAFVGLGVGLIGRLIHL